MTGWRDSIQAQSATQRPFTGSLSGVPFMMPGNEVEGGRRTVVHEFPQADLPIIDDLGGKAKAFQLTVWVDATLASTGNYLDARNALLAVLDKPGPMTLVHPWMGRMSVSQAQPYRLTENWSNGGRATFTLSLIQDAGFTVAPVASVDTQSTVQLAAGTAQAAASADFTRNWQVDNQPSWGLAALESDLTNTLNGLETTVAGITTDVAAQIRAPYNMASAIIGAVNRVASDLAVPVNAFNLYRSLFSAGDDSPAIAPTTPLRVSQANAAWSLHQLVQRAAVAAAASLSSTQSFGASSDALTTLGELLDAIDALTLASNPATGQPIDDDVYIAFNALRAALVADLRTRGAQLPELVTYTPAATVPSLVVAWRLYGDSSRAGEIVQRNNVRLPGFVPGGTPLEVLNV